MAQHMAEHQEIKTLADAIIQAQQAEIAQMQSWLKEWFGIGATFSPYIGQLDSPVRGLSAQEVDDLRAGRGMGFARMAELNNYPGPRHLLDLQQLLRLSPKQAATIQGIFDEMQTQAQALGEQILTQEAQLGTAFAQDALDEAVLQSQVMALADLYGQLRMIHLRAHLQVTPLLTPEQLTTYNKLRGYNDAGEHSHTD
jgi:Spy/CpxP family protein refolding chaperone